MAGERCPGMEMSGEWVVNKEIIDVNNMSKKDELPPDVVAEVAERALGTVGEKTKSVDENNTDAKRAIGAPENFEAFVDSQAGLEEKLVALSKEGKITWKQASESLRYFLESGGSLDETAKRAGIALGERRNNNEEGGKWEGNERRKNKKSADVVYDRDFLSKVGQLERIAGRYSENQDKAALSMIEDALAKDSEEELERILKYLEAEEKGRREMEFHEDDMDIKMLKDMVIGAIRDKWDGK